MVLRSNKTISMFVLATIAIASLSLASPLIRHRAQERNRTVTPRPPSESQQMCDALTALGRRAELLLFDDDGHEIDKRENRAVLLKAMTDWLTQAFAG